MAHLLTLGRLASERPIEFTVPLEEQLQGWRDASVGELDRGEHSLPGGSGFDFNWQLPLAPPRDTLRDTLLLQQESSLDEDSLRFPLRDALLSEVTPTFLSGVLGSSGGTVSKSLKSTGMAQTEKSKARALLGRQKRLHLEESRHSAAVPAPPPHRSVSRPIASRATQSRQDRRMRAEQDGASQWPLSPSASAPALGGSQDEGGSSSPLLKVRGTWTSAARAVLAHSRTGQPRYTFMGAASEGPPTGEWHQGAIEPWPSVQHSGHETASWRGLPQQVALWAKKGLEFTDKGIGIGERSSPVLGFAKGPGLVYQVQDYGSVAAWSPQASKQTRQVVSKYTSCETHKIGRRRDPAHVTTWEKQRPGPGTYEYRGFVEELSRKSSVRQPKKSTAMAVDTAKTL